MDANSNATLIVNYWRNSNSCSSMVKSKTSFKLYSKTLTEHFPVTRKFRRTASASLRFGTRLACPKPDGR